MLQGTSATDRHGSNVATALDAAQIEFDFVG
jgi:hypothetical protein